LNKGITVSDTTTTSTDRTEIPTPPPRKPRKALKVGLGVMTVGLALAIGIGIGVGASGNHATMAPAAKPAAAAPAAPAASQAAPAPGSIQDWWASVGKADLARVQADYSLQDAAALAADAQTAINDANSAYTAAAYSAHPWDTAPQGTKFYQDFTYAAGQYRSIGQAMSAGLDYSGNQVQLASEAATSARADVRAAS
jgi:hypothetical protein